MTKGPSSSWLKWLILVVLVAGVVGAGVWYFAFRNESEAQYQTAAVTRGDITQAVTATGQLNPVLNVQVGSQVSGRINKIMVDYNSEVKSNQVIAQIDPSSYQSALLRAQAELSNSKANLTLTQVQAHRAESLFTNNLISASDHDTALAQEEQAKALVQSAEAAVENAKVDLSRCTIYAPVDGVVISRNVDVGQTVASSFNTPTLFVIANDLSRMQIDALVSEADIGGVTVGQNAKFQVDAFPYRTFNGKVKQIRYGAMTNQNVVNYDCVVEVNNEDLKLLPGMTANLSIIIAARTNVLRVPNAALRFRPPEVIAAETNSVARAPSDTTKKGPPGAGGGAEMAAGGPGGASSPGGRKKGGGEEGGSRAAGSGGARGAGGAGGGSTRPKPERAGPRTVYVADNSNPKAIKLKPVKVRTGITDAAFTEITEGLNDGDPVVTALLATSSSSGSQRPSNPFGGGSFRRM
jgi:HlyD family secretion protein